MDIAVRLGALVIALGMGALAWIAARGALAFDLTGPLYPGQVRGLLFAAAMTAVTIGLLWVAFRADRRAR
jgi:hypothetical protein